MISLLIIIIVAAALMNIGALTLIDYGSFFDEKAAELNAPHVVAVIDKGAYRPGYLDFLESDLSVTKTSVEDVLFMRNCGFSFGGGKQNQGIIFQNINTKRDMAPFTITGPTEEITANSIYAPFLLQTGGGYEVGGGITLEYENQEYTFRIAGFVEDIMLGSANMGVMGFYLPEPLYKKLMSEGRAQPAVMVSAQLSEASLDEEVSGGYNAYLSDDKALLWGFPVSIVKSARTMIADISSMIMVAFAIIIAAAALIVMRFRISDTIRDDIKDIGVLKAMGYTAAQIKAAVMLQFFSLTALGGILGIALSYLLLPLISSMFSSQAGLIWNQGFAPLSSAICLIILLAAVAANVYGSLRRIKNLHPVAAIRGETKLSGRKRNFFRLDKTNSGLQFTLACKMIMQNLGQNIIVALIIATVTFAAAFGLVFYYNMAIDSESFLGTIGGELCSAVVSPGANLNPERLREEVSAMPGVRKAIFYDGKTVLIDDVEYMADISADFDEVEGFMLYEGNYPKSAFEAAVGGSACERMGKMIGDTVMIGEGGSEAEYLITGYIQSGNYMGNILSLTDEGIRRIAPDFTPDFIYVYLQEGEEAGVFIEALENRYGNAVNKPINMDELIEGQTQTYIAIVTLMAIVILIITAVIVTLILYFVIKTMIARRKRDFGVQKALGYTTFQLVQQIALSFLPVVFIGAIAGSVAGCLGINPLITALFRFIGIMRFDMIIVYSWLVILCAGMVLLSYAVAMAISYRLRGISAYVLATE